MRASSSKHPNMPLILKILRERPETSIAYLSRTYDVPDATIRRARQTDIKRAAMEVDIAKIAGGAAHVVQRPVERVVNTSQGSSVVLAIPDLHCPFQHINALSFLRAVKRKFKPTHIVCLGDEIDAHAYSKWPKDPDGMGPGQELKAAIEALVPFYVEFPNVQVCISNHTIRPQKMMQSIGLGAAFWPRYETMLNSPDGWTWHEYIYIDGVRYIHGDQGKVGQNGWTKNSEVYHQSVVVGHWHSKAGVYYDSAMFNLNTGCLIDPKAYAFGYAKNSHKKPNLGCGLIIGGKEAHFIPMHTDAEGRWTGVING